MKKKIIYSLIGLFVGIFVAAEIGGVSPADAAGHIGVRNVDPSLRTDEVRYTYVSRTAASSGDHTAGADGIIATERFIAGSSNTLSNTSTIAALPYPCKIKIFVDDGGNTGGDALTCTGDLVICGFNQFGRAVGDVAASGNTSSGCETITTDLTEGTAVKSARVYERITSISFAACSGASHSEAANQVVAACSPEIGLPLPIDAVGGAVSICLIDDESTDVTRCYNSGAISEDIDLGDDSVMLHDGNTYSGVSAYGVGNSDTVGGAALNQTVVQGDIVIIRVRPPAGL